MAGHPQGTNRGFKATQRLDVGAMSITANSTGAVVSGALYVSGKTNTKLTANTTGIIASGALTVSGQATMGKLSANSTALILPNSVRVGALASYISANTTGIKIGSRYISTNTTGNTTT